MSKVDLIIQARANSTRLKRKSFKQMRGKPLLWHVIERAKRCQTVDQISVATTRLNDDREIVEIADACKVRAFTGSENDVLRRYYDCAWSSMADVVVRMTGDCPLIHPPTVDAMVTLLKEKEVDYVCPDPRHRSLETGVEVFTMDALEKMHKRAKEGYQKEHVTLYLREHPEEFSIALYVPDPMFQRKDIRLTVDYPEDLEVIRHLYRKFYRDGDILDLKQVVEYLDQHPAIRESNIQSKLSEANQLSISDSITENIIRVADAQE